MKLGSNPSFSVKIGRYVKPPKILKIRFSRKMYIHLLADELWVNSVSKKSENSQLVI